MDEEHKPIYLKSLGIDVGTTTSHIVYSLLKLEKVYSPQGRLKFEVTERKILYRGNIILTPIDIENQTIDYFELIKFLKEEYKKANIKPEDIDTGAVIITGESAKKHNAEDLVKALAHKAGRFVAATAGPNFESVIAAMGSGAVKYSKENRKNVINIDIGGGTSNIAVVSNGKVVAASCVNVGGRLLAFDSENRIIRIEEPIRRLEPIIGIKFDYGISISEETKQKIAKYLAESLFDLLFKKNSSNLAQNLLMTNPLSFEEEIDQYSFSGGVAEYIYERTTEDYNDLGKYLGIEILKLVKKHNLSLYTPKELIRATVIGAGQYTLKVSGVTTHVSDNDILPLHNIPVIEPKLNGKQLSIETVSKAIIKSYKMFDKIDGQDVVALLFKGAIGGSYAGLTTFVKGIEKAIPKTIENELPIILVFEKDIANSVGNVMVRETAVKQNIVSIDEIDVEEGDFIDIDKPKAGGLVVPVVVKSLVFSN
ncbi:MAG: ethanolamine ammonia-lyase reactivating factor EutA [Candidatus Heimdallarchaeaceae archaeon]